MKTVFDSIYGFIEFPDDIWRIIDHPLFQRLDRLKQCGIVSQVYPSATHTRKSHSLGVAHLARRWAQHLIDQGGASNYDGDAEPETIVNIITIAALLHDVGHGPFSHLFECMLGKLDIKDAHEDRSIQYIKEMNLWCETEVIDVLRGHVSINEYGIPTWPKMPTWAYQIVSNSTTGLDADRFDYLARDSYYTIRLFDASLIDRVIKNSRLDTAGNIVFLDKIADDILHVYKTRYDMFNRVYCHRTVMKLEAVILAAFEEYVEATGADVSSLARLDDFSLLHTLRTHPTSAPYIELYDSRKFLDPGPKTYELAISYSKTNQNPLEKVGFMDARGGITYGASIPDLPQNFLNRRAVTYSLLSAYFLQAKSKTKI